VRLGDQFTEWVVTARPEHTLAAVAHSMREHNVGTVVVLEARRPVDIVTDCDLALALGARGLSRQAPSRRS
jgi:CBS domain-containing protein